MSEQAAVKGFTLVEMIVVMVIISTLLALAVPGMISLTSEARARFVTSEVASILVSSRSEAVSRGVPIHLCSSDDGSECLASDAVWGPILMSFIDLNLNETFDAGEEIVLQVALPEFDALSIIANDGENTLTFTPQGYLDRSVSIRVTSGEAAIRSVCAERPGMTTALLSDRCPHDPV